MRGEQRSSPVLWKSLLKKAVSFAFVCISAMRVVPPVVAQTNTAAAYTFTTLAGYALSQSSDGLGPLARFDQPGGIASDTNGNFYVVDELNLTIRKITAAGVVSTIAGLPGVRGDDDGIGSAARFYDPKDIAADQYGNLFVTDNYQVREISPIGTNWLVTSIAGQLATGGYRDGLNLGARFNGPGGLVTDGLGNIYVADGAVRKITHTGSNWVVSTVANPQGYTIIQNNSGPNFTNYVGVFSGSATEITMDASDNLYVTDQNGGTVSELSPQGTNWVSATIAGLSGSSGSADGLGADARFQSPTGIAIDGLGNLYVTDQGGTAIRALMPQGTNWWVSTLAGSPGNPGSMDGIGTNALFKSVFGVAVDPANNLLVTDSGNNEILKVTSSGVVSTVAGSLAVSYGSVDGVGGDARYNEPAGVAVDRLGNVYVSDWGNDTIRMITSAGIVTTLAGLAGQSGTNDGLASNARFNQPEGIAVDSVGNVFVADGSDTIRMITPAAAVTTIAGTAGVVGDMDGPGNQALFAGTFDVAVDSQGNLFMTDPGNAKIKELTRTGTNWVVNTIAIVGGNPNGLALAGDGLLYVINNDQIQQLSLIGTNWIVGIIAGNYSGDYDLAADPQGNLYIGSTSSHTVTQIAPVGTNWVSTVVGGSPGTFPYFAGGNADGAGSLASFQVPYGFAADSAGNIYVSDAVNNNIREGIFTEYVSGQAAAYSPPALNATLQVTLTPPEANGQWRFPWELGWHNSGDTLTNLAAGNYEVEFRSVPGWLAIPIPAVQVTSGNTTSITNEYLPTINANDANSSPGSLTVFLGPTPPVGAGWRFLGDGGPFFPTGFTTNLLPGTYLIEFAPVSGRVNPPSQAVLVNPGLPSYLTVNYLLASTPPAGVYLPFPVPASEATNETTYPFGYNGQLQTDVGYGSGVAVANNVVLTAAHLVFNDQTLSYVSGAYWFFQRNPGASEPLPQAARGWYVLSGYAAQRTNDLQSGYSPDQSTPPSRNLDVAALYFPLPVAGGGSGGYLPSDAVPNSWLASSALKMLAGYPVDGSQFGDASIVPGQMYQTEPQPYPLSIASDPVPGQQEVYVAPWVLSYPGNSGGPLYVQFNGAYYPAAVYLGTLFSGSQPYASVVRAIDGSVVNLITLAATLGDSGTNNTGGGVVTIIPSQDINATHPGYVQFQLAPPEAVAAGAGWRLQGDTTYSSLPNYTRAVTSTNAFAVEFEPIPGWNLPANQSVVVVPGQLITNVAFYSVISPQMELDPGLGLGLTGTTGTTYRIDFRTNLSVGQWLPVSTNTLGPGLNRIFNWPPSNGPAAFYRAVWLP